MGPEAALLAMDIGRPDPVLMARRAVLLQADTYLERLGLCVVKVFGEELESRETNRQVRRRKSGGKILKSKLEKNQPSN